MELNENKEKVEDVPHEIEIKKEGEGGEDPMAWMNVCGNEECVIINYFE